MSARARGSRHAPTRPTSPTPTQVAELIARIVDDFGGIDVLHSHAGRLRAGTVGETDLEEWNRTLVGERDLDVPRGANGGAGDAVARWRCDRDDGLDQRPLR